MEPERELIRRARTGDDHAFARLARDVRPLVLRWAMVLTASADDAEDVAQMSLMSAHRSLSQFREEARFSTWLYAIVRRAASDWRRAQRRRVARESRYAREWTLSASRSSGTEGDVDLRLQAALGLLERLPGRQRQVFDLIELQGRSADDAAALLGLEPSTVRVHLLRARRAIRAAMLETDPHSEHQP